jgi:type VI secretion system protein ImpK
MRDDLADVVFPVLAHGLRTLERLRDGEKLDMAAVQSELRTLLKTAAEAQRYPDYAGDGEHFLGVRYALACWLDEVFIRDSPWRGPWTERQMEWSLYGTNDRAWKFWKQADIAEARQGTDALEAYYLCAMLGFRGELSDQTNEFLDRCSRYKDQISRTQSVEFPGPQELQPEPNNAPRHGREKLRRVLIWSSVALGVLIFAAVFLLIYNLRSS